MSHLSSWKIDEVAFEALTNHACKHIYPFKWGQNQDIEMQTLGYVTNRPGIIYEITNVYRFDEKEIEAWKHVFRGYGAEEVFIEIDTVNRSMMITVHFDPETRMDKKKSIMSNLYKLPSLFAYVPNFLWFYALLAAWKPQRYGLL